MRISVVILCLNEQERIGQCLDSLANQDFPGSDYEVLVIDNGSTDGSLALIEERARRMDNLRLAVNPRRGIATSRNMGLALAAYPYAAFTDADCIPPPDWLTVLARGWERHRKSEPNLVAVGGANRAPERRSGFYDAVNVVLKTPLGNRNSTQGCEFGRDERVDHIPTLNVLYDREAVLAAGGFDEDFLFVCEDPDLNYRLVAAGKTLVHLKDSCVTHSFRPGLLEWARKIFGYGQGRTQLLRKHPGKFSLLYAVPASICALYVLALAAPLLGFRSVLPLCAYFAGMAVYAAIHCLRRKRPGLIPYALALYLLTHASYGLGQIWGLWRTPTQSRLRGRTPEKEAEA